MSFILKDIGKIANEKCEKTDEGRQKLENFRKKVCSNKLVASYTNCGDLKAAVASSIYRCIQNSPALGWIRGDNTEKNEDLDARIEKYMREHTISNGEIDSLFRGDGIILDCGNSSCI